VLSRSACKVTRLLPLRSKYRRVYVLGSLYILYRLKVSDVTRQKMKRSLRDFWIGNRKFRKSFIQDLIKDFLHKEIARIVSATIAVSQQNSNVVIFLALLNTPEPHSKKFYLNS